jgi:hypothetical protein
MNPEGGTHRQECEHEQKRERPAIASYDHTHHSIAFCGVQVVGTATLPEKLSIVQSFSISQECRAWFPKLCTFLGNYLTCRAIVHHDESLQEELYEALQKRSRFHGLTLDVTSVGSCDACWESQTPTKKEPISQRGNSKENARTWSNRLVTKANH